MEQRANELAPALRKQLERTFRNRLGDLEPFRVSPYVVSCVKGGFETEVAVFARSDRVVFFVSLDALRFGAGRINKFGDIIESTHYPTITMATRSFLGMAKEP